MSVRFTSVSKNYDVMNDAMSFGMRYGKNSSELACVEDEDVIL